VGGGHSPRTGKVATRVHVHLIVSTQVDKWGTMRLLAPAAASERGRHAGCGHMQAAGTRSCGHMQAGRRPGPHQWRNVRSLAKYAWYRRREERMRVRWIRVLKVKMANTTAGDRVGLLVIITACTDKCGVGDVPGPHSEMGLLVRCFNREGGIGPLLSPNPPWGLGAPWTAAGAAAPPAAHAPCTQCLAGRLRAGAGERLWCLQRLALGLAAGRRDISAR
jgi:plasmid stabilization system protein ParE